MSYSLDVNILLYASDQSTERHAVATSFLESCVSAPEPCYLAWPTLMSYLRITTHPSIFVRPLAPNEALANVEALAGLPHVRLLSESEGFLDTYLEVTGSFPVRGNLVPDAHLAALLRQNQVRTLYTTDADFRKFDFLEIRNPLLP